MRTARWPVAVVALGLLLVPALAAAEAPVLGVEFSLEPGEAEGTYLARVLLSDADTGELLSAPSVLFRAGETAKAKTSTPDGEVIELEVAVAADGSEVTYEAALIRDEKRLGLQKATLKLAG